MCKLPPEPAPIDLVLGDRVGNSRSISDDAIALLFDYLVDSARWRGAARTCLAARGVK